MPRAKTKYLLVLLTLLALVGFFAIPGLPIAHAAGITVNSTADTVNASDGSCTLREAITQANANTGPVGPVGECGGASGADTITFSVSGTITLDSALPAINDTLTIDGTGQNITLSGNNNDRVLEVNSAKVLNLEQLTIADGYFTDNGGGIVNNGTLHVSDSTFTNNSSYFAGGAIANSGTATVTNSTFTNNSSTNSDGGGIFNGGTLTVSNSTFSGNSAAGGGGAIGSNGSLITIINSTLYNNSATHAGGGIHNGPGHTAIIINSTLAGNSWSGSGFGGGGVSNMGIMTLKNSILANNTPAGQDCWNRDLTGVFVNAYNTLIKDGLTCVTGTGSNNLTGDPLLGGLHDNGGPTQTMALGASSPALDKGDNSLALDADGNALTTDQRGTGFQRVVNDTVDMGAYERAANTPTPTATSTNTPTDTHTDTPTPYPGAVNLALAANGGSIAAFSSNYGGEWDVHNLIDGTTTAGWSSDGFATNQYVIVRLANGGSYTINRVRLDPAATGGDGTDANLKDFEIRVSTSFDPSTFDPNTFDPSSFDTVLSATAPQQDALLDYTFANTSAKYVMLYGVNNYGAAYLEAAELEVYSGSPVVIPSNTPTRTPTQTLTPTKTATAGGPTQTATQTPTKTSTPTRTPTKINATRTPTRTNTPPSANTPTPTATTASCSAKPGKPTLKKPANGTTVTQSKVKLDWSDATCADSYQVTVKNTQTGKKVFKTTVTKSKAKTGALPPGTYQWSVKASNTHGAAKSSKFTFTR